MAMATVAKRLTAGGRRCLMAENPWTVFRVLSWKSPRHQTHEGVLTCENGQTRPR